MKILLMNPHIDADHPIGKALAARGVAVLFASNADEGWKMLQLHGQSVELAVIHVEGAEEGLSLVRKMKADPVQADLAFVLSSSTWSDERFVQHQGTAEGANAYLRWPFEPAQLCDLLDSLFPSAESSMPTVEQSPSPPSPPPRLEPPTFTVNPPPSPEPPSVTASLSSSMNSSVLILEDASNIFRTPVPEHVQNDAARITLDPPSQVGTYSEANLGQDNEAKVEPAAPTGVFSEGVSESFTASSIDLSGLAAEEEPAVDAAVDVALPELQVSGSVEAVSGSVSEPVLDATPSQEMAGLSEPEPEINEEELAAEMPYLFSPKTAPKAPPGSESALVGWASGFTQPVGDAVVPGGAAQTPDIETLKKYLMLREQDVAILSNQLGSTQEQVGNLEIQLKAERSANAEMQRMMDEQRRRLDEFEKEKALALEGLQGEITDLRFQVKAKVDKARVLETQVREAATEIERLKDRVRSDIRKIRVREKELENRLEIVKKDSEALISARETKIIELKRKVDLLEFNMDLLQDQYSREKETSAKLREKLVKAAQVVRVAGGLLDANAPTAEDGASKGGQAEAAAELTGREEEREKAS